MAFSVSVADRISFGNKKLLIVNLTGVLSSGSSYKVGQNVYAVKAVNNTDSSDTFKEAVGADSSSSTRNQVTFTSVTDNDNGHAWIIYD